MHCSNCNGGDKELEREEMTEVEQFKNKLKDGPGDHLSRYRWH